jgi:predicted metal-dependent HD superfamily phosphohydrolase
LNSRATNNRFETIWSRTSNLTDDDGNGIGRELFHRYAEPDRYFHTIEHIDYCLEMFDQVRELCANPDAVELAIWFHDAVYDFPVDDNERLSAEYFLTVSQGKLPEDLRQLVFDQVIVTDHRSTPTDSDQQLLIDIDLSSFGQPWERFLKDGANVRLEMSYIEDTEFYESQIAFMSQLLNRTHFYGSEWFQKHFEQNARGNVTRYLQTLADKGYTVN